MDEKTEELRDIFVSVTDEERVTESQAETPGSLASEEDVDERLARIVAELRDRQGFDADLDDEERVALVREFYADASDSELAAALGVDADTVVRARLDLHLLRESDSDVPFDLADLRELLDEDVDDGTLADRLDAPVGTVARARRVVETRDEIRRVNDRYRHEYENVLRDRDLADRLTEHPSEDGLDGATEGQEIDLSF